MWIPDTIHQFKNINGPAWTLSVELFFYLIFPFLAPLARRCPTRTLIVLILIIGAFIMMSQSSAPGHNKGAPFDWMHYVPLPILRLPEFLLGIGLSEYFLRGGRWPRIPAWIFAAATIGVMAVSPSRAVSGFVTVFAGLLILAIAYDRNSRFYRFLSAKWLVVLGGASYAIYLLHVSLRHYLDMLVGETLSRFLQFPMVIIAGLFVFIAFEEPIRAWLKARLGGKNVERRLVLSPAP